MKKATAMIAILVIIAMATSTWAISPIKLYAGGGLTLPNKPADFKSYYNTGFHGMIGVGMKAFPFIEGIGKIEYHKFSSDISEEVSGGEFNTLLLGVDAKVAVGIPGIPVKPYAIVGAGLAKVTQKNFDIPDGINDEVKTLANGLSINDQTKLYYNLAIGGEYGLLPAITLFAEGRLINIGTSQDTEISVSPSFDSDTRLWAVTIGVKVL